MRKVFITALTLGLLFGCKAQTPGKGEKVGQVVRLTESGIFFKTHEAELIRGGMSGGSGVMGVVPFDFTVEDDSLVRVIEDALRNQQEITITYEREGIYALYRSESGGNFLKTVQVH